MSFVLFILAMLAVAVTQALAGGRVVALCLPAYGLLAVAAILSWWPRRRTPIPRASAECLIVCIAFSAYISVRALLSPEPYLARTDLYTALAGLVLYLIVALNVTASRLRMLLVGVLLTLAVANCAVGAVQYFKGQNFMIFAFLPRPEYGSRASGFYGYPNHLAGFLEMALMLGLSVTFWSRLPSWSKMLAGYVCVMCILGILVTGSRGGYISCAIGLLVFGLLSLVLVGKLASGRVIGVLVVGLLLIAGGAYGVRQVMAKSFLVNNRTGETLRVDVSRMRLWQAAWMQFRLKPVVGTGSGTYAYYGRQFRSPGLQSDPVHAHNDYFELLAEYGLIGMVGVVIVIESHLRRGWNAFTSRLTDGVGLEGMGSNSLALNVGALSAAAACLTHAMLDYNLHMPANLFTAAVIFGLLATPGEGRDLTEEERESGLPPFLRLIVPVAGILLAVRVAPTAPAELDAERTRRILSDWHRSVAPEPNEELIALAQRGLTWDPRNPELYFAIGEAQSALGDQANGGPKATELYTQSAESYTRALELAPGNVFYVLALASVLDAVPRHAEAQLLYERALTLDPHASLPHNAYGDHLVQVGKLDEAAAQFRLGAQYGGRQGAEVGFHSIQEKKKAPNSPGATPAAAPNVN